MYKRFFKRFLDVTLSVAGLVILSPVFVAVTVLLFMVNKGKPFFTQLRPGRHGKIFKIIKFKTMNDKRDAAGNLLSDTERLTSVGRFVRKTSLDEIPQLINVIIGDMSLIGPRPLLAKYLPYYTEREKLRHSVRPGITGWAQVNGRNMIDWDERLELDVTYVEQLSFKLDIEIFFRTIINVVISKNLTVITTGHLDFDVYRKDKQIGT
jgi:lipopolysaccharide/colanic/teichoic acid biosynthesis glycosyltransferase